MLRQQQFLQCGIARQIAQPARVGCIGQAPGFVQIPAGLAHLRQVDLRANGLFDLVGSEQCERTLQLRLCLGVVAQRDVGFAQCRVQLCGGGGLTGQVRIDACGAGVDQILCADLAAFCIGRIDAAKNRFEESVHRFGARGLRARDLRLPGGDAGARDHGQRDGSSRGQAHPVTSREFADAIRRAVCARQDRAAIAPAPHVLRQRFHAGVATRRLRVGRARHDDAGIAAQCARVHPRRAARARALARKRQATRWRARGRVRVVMKARAGQQFEQQHAKLENIHGRAGGGAGDLLRRRVGARQHARGSGGLLRGARVFQHFGDAEIEQVRAVVRIDEHVRRLDVAVHDQQAVRMRDRIAQLHDDIATRVEVDVRALAPVIERNPIDVRHDQVGSAIRTDAAVEKGRDRGVRQAREDFALAAEARQDFVRIHAAPDQLERAALDGAIDFAFGQVHRAHPARAEQVPRRPSIQGKARRVCGDLVNQRIAQQIGECGRRRGRRAGAGKVGEQAPYIRRVAGVQAIEPRRARGDVHVQRLIQQRGKRAPALRIEGFHRLHRMGFAPTDENPRRITTPPCRRFAAARRAARAP